MAIKRYVATKDNTITNAFKANLSTRGTGSNMGASDISEVFSIYGQANSSSIEKSRLLTEFSTTDIQADRTAGNIPASGSVKFYLKLYNAPHASTTPKDYTLVVHAVSRSWAEGIGLDMEGYEDTGACNWIAAQSASSGETAWTTEGGDFHTGAYAAGTNLPFYSQTFSSGREDLEINVTALVEEWLAGGSGARANYGVGVYLTSSQESGDGETSYYTKKFFARKTEFFYKKPIIEARWDSSNKDNAGSFYLSSSRVPAADNLNTLFLYNEVRGQLKDIPGLDQGKLRLSVYSSLGGEKITLPLGGGVSVNNHTNVTGGYIDTGIYTASFAYTGSSTAIYPVWHSGSTEYLSASAITVKTFDGSRINPNPKYVSKITNLRSTYDKHEVARFRLYTRQKDWSPTIYTKASTDIETSIVEDAYYRVVRTVDALEIIPYGTGTLNYTRVSYDASGSYFDLDMQLLEPGYSYLATFVYYINGAYQEQPEMFKFRVE